MRNGILTLSLSLSPSRICYESWFLVIVRRLVASGDFQLIICVQHTVTSIRFAANFQGTERLGFYLRHIRLTINSGTVCKEIRHVWLVGHVLGPCCGMYLNSEIFRIGFGQTIWVLLGSGLQCLPGWHMRTFFMDSGLIFCAALSKHIKDYARYSQ